MTDDVGSTSDDELDDLIRGSLPQLDVVAFMRLADLDLPDQLAPGELAPDQPLPDPTGSGHEPTEAGALRLVGRSGSTPRTRPAVLRLAGLIGVAAAIVALGLYLTNRSDPDDRLGVTGSEGEPTTSINGTAFGPHVNPVEHLTDVADRSLALRSELGDLTPAVDALIGEPLVSKDLTVGDYFPAPTFPALSPLPGRTAWIFVNPRSHSATDPCALFAPRSITMTGFAGPAWISDTSDVSVVTYTATGPAEATDLFAGRSLQLGASAGECVADTSGNIVVSHRALMLTTPPAGIDQWNSWTFSAPDPLLADETGAYGFVVRRGDQIFEIRVGAKNHRVFTPEELSTFVDAVIR